MNETIPKPLTLRVCEVCGEQGSQLSGDFWCDNEHSTDAPLVVEYVPASGSEGQLREALEERVAQAIHYAREARDPDSNEAWGDLGWADRRDLLEQARAALAAVPEGERHWSASERERGYEAISDINWPPEAKPNLPAEPRASPALIGVINRADRFLADTEGSEDG